MPIALPETMITTYLEMTTREEFLPGFLDAEQLAAQEVIILPMAQFDAPFYRFLYREVGGHWRWYMRRDLGDEALAERHAAENLRLDVLYVGGAPAGFIELAMHDAEAKAARAVEVAYFGLREAYFGRGLGKHLLSHGVQAAWEAGARRVWLRTCNLDAPQALPNYLRRGFRITKTEKEPMPARYHD